MNHNEITLTEDEAVLYDYSKVIVYCNKHKTSCKIVYSKIVISIVLYNHCPL